MTDSLLVRGGDVLDLVAGEYLAGHDVLSRSGRVVEVGRGLSAPDDARVVDATGLRVLPGLVDCHVHVTAATADLGALPTWAPSYVAAHAGRLMRDMLHRGFTTVRDTGGADFGLAQAQAEGLVTGPRLAFGGKALSQTGGHGDVRGPGADAQEEPGCCASMGRVVDGVEPLRVAARDELRKGAHHLKVMAGGGVSSPTDRIDSTQYSLDELRAVVAEAEAANRYVAAHAYTARAIDRALEAGIRTIEHGNLLDAHSVELFLAHDAFLVPTLVTYWALKEEGREFGLPQDSWEKVDAVLDAGIGALQLAAAAGVKIAYGSDLLGGMQRHQSQEFRIRADVLPSLDVLRSATTVAAELLGMVGEVGVLTPGAHADLVLVDGDPLQDAGILADPGKHVPVVVQAGHVVLDRR
ncbi:metal-dependent hydrolase family protein [Kineococcus rubinsiae]|uniref:metal-dependent hydrolase family protein n=1 Tax=Kineococcus rubinsiae TaxID=2609562 RepID=UPI001431A867|nr:amidohydrolase family protein [Kineococcus rubinsiae]NIZ91030.1 amidohydrolase family protein [Kineococcus rubinsiae]